MQADGALEKKLEAYVEVNKFYAGALQNIKQPIVPAIIAGGDGSGGRGQTAAQDLMDLLMIKAARDLSLDAMPGGARK